MLGRATKSKDHGLGSQQQAGPCKIVHPAHVLDRAVLFVPFTNLFLISTFGLRWCHSGPLAPDPLRVRICADRRVPQLFLTMAALDMPRRSLELVGAESFPVNLRCGVVFNSESIAVQAFGIRTVRLLRCEAVSSFFHGRGALQYS